MKPSRIRLALGALALGGTLALTGCTETVTFEAVPVGVDDDDAENGIDPDVANKAKCFTIEADSSNGDDNDRQLGTFCKTDVTVTESDDVEAETD